MSEINHNRTSSSKIAYTDEVSEKVKAINIILPYERPVSILLGSITTYFNEESFDSITISQLYEYVFKLLSTLATETNNEDETGPKFDTELVHVTQLKLIHSGKPLTQNNNNKVTTALNLQMNNTFLLNVKPLDLEENSSSSGVIHRVLSKSGNFLHHGGQTIKTIDNQATYTTPQLTAVDNGGGRGGRGRGGGGSCCVIV